MFGNSNWLNDALALVDVALFVASVRSSDVTAARTTEPVDAARDQTKTSCKLLQGMVSISIGGIEAECGETSRVGAVTPWQQ